MGLCCSPERPGPVQPASPVLSFPRAPLTTFLLAATHPSHGGAPCFMLTVSARLPRSDAEQNPQGREQGWQHSVCRKNPHQVRGRGGVGAAAAPPGASLQSLYQLTMQLNPEGTHTQAKVGRRPTQTVLQGRHTDGQEADEKMLNRTNY